MFSCDLVTVFFYSKVDTGSPVLFLNKRTCDLLLQRSPSIEFRDITRYPIDTLYVDYNKKPIRQLGSIQIPISSSGWRVANAQFLISENRTRNLLGLDLQEKLGIVTTQLKAEAIKSVDSGSSDPISEYWCSFFAKKYAHVFSRLGRSKIIKYTLILNSHWCHVKSKEEKFLFIFKIGSRVR